MLKKGLSGVVATIILVLLVLVAVGIVWGAIRGIINEKIDIVNSCFGNFEKATINSQYTCYNSSSNEFRFSIDIKDTEIDKLLISISGRNETKSFEIPQLGSSLIRNYNGNYNEDIKLPGKNAGLTYVANISKVGKPSLIKIAPIIGGNQCEISDSLSEIDDCILLIQ
ncbi:MAG: hypothetical protein QF567_02720 [Candidatus Pacearchaeota archaeon]|jgi:flagellin-like protein|nr:hypothetical protein [Candidatus Pacearchaeota archaeon]MDP7521121.1 hypothetical protein [Candidatus Pacearchaeota archaeon]|tara:strand:+ start:636 stop:1139 length:504 start_codon:yes stop_codon:yes gene_type:complete